MAKADSNVIAGHRLVFLTSSSSRSYKPAHKDISTQLSQRQVWIRVKERERRTMAILDSNLELISVSPKVAVAWSRRPEAAAMAASHLDFRPPPGGGGIDWRRASACTSLISKTASSKWAMAVIHLSSNKGFVDEAASKNLRDAPNSPADLCVTPRMRLMCIAEE